MKEKETFMMRNMLLKVLAPAVMAVGGVPAIASAHGHADFRFSFGCGYAPAAYCAPVYAPVCATPAPAVVYTYTAYTAPAPVVCTPPVVYSAPAVVYAPPAVVYAAPPVVCAPSVVVTRAPVIVYPHEHWYSHAVFYDHVRCWGR
jgi:hypothetical protein